MITKLFPYLYFEGKGQEATHFYTDALGGKIAGILTYGEANEGDMEGVPEAARDMIMNAQVDLENGDLLMISDVVPEMGTAFRHGTNMALTLFFNDMEEARTVFHKLAEEGTISMELHKTFWSPLFGTLTDKFGIDWQISVEGETS